VTLLLKIAAVGLLHMAFFSTYPETGGFGNYYLSISMLVWSVFIIFINTSTSLVKLVSGAAGLVINLAAFSLMALAIAATMPQLDHTSVLDKLRARQYPTTGTVKSGMLRFGIRLDNNVDLSLKRVNTEVNKTLKTLKEDQ
jgi:hypothetical protein